MNELIVQIKNGNLIIGDDDVGVDDGDDGDLDFDDDDDDDDDVSKFYLTSCSSSICHFVLPLKVGLIDLHFFPIHSRAKISICTIRVNSLIKQRFILTNKK